MAIGTVAAIALGAGALGSAAISSSASGKASRAASQAADQSAAVQREQLQVAQNALSPYGQAGVPASNAINALLGIGTNNPDYNSYLSANPDVMQGYYQTADKSQFSSPEEYARWHYQNYGAGEKRTLPTNGTTANQAFDTYRNSTGYNFRLNQGLDAVKSGFAGSGMLQSGAAMKSLNDYGQGMASQEFGNYLGALGNQQGLGLSAGSALAGVGQNYANSLAQINSNKADAIGNSALLNARNMNTMFNGLATGILGR